MSDIQIAVTASLLLTACVLDTDDEVTSEQATEIANSHLTEILPQVDQRRLSINVTSGNKVWRVEYAAPEGSAGGPILIDVNKRTSQVTRTSIGQ